MYTVSAECDKPACNARNHKDRDVLEAKRYVGHDLAPHQLVLLPLYAHTQHGACGLKCRLDGEPIL